MIQVAVAAIAKDEHAYLEEWAKHHVDMGVGMILLYDHMSEVPLQETVDAMPDRYRNKVVCRRFDAPLAERPQVKAYCQMVKELKGVAEWAAFIDIDEFLMIKGTTLPKLLRQAKVCFPQAGQIFLSWKTFNANGHWHNDGKPVVERFMQEFPNDRLPLFAREGHGKCLVKPLFVKAPDVHHFEMNTGIHTIRPDMSEVRNWYHENIPFMYDILWVNHYYTKSHEEWVWRITKRGTADRYHGITYDTFFKFNPDMRDGYDKQYAGIRIKGGGDVRSARR